MSGDQDLSMVVLIVIGGHGCGVDLDDRGG